MIQIPTFRQGDKPWGSRQIGVYDGKPVTMASHGCYITTMCMLFWNFSIKLDPGQFLDQLQKHRALLPDGQLTYDGLMRAFPAVFFHERIESKNERTSGAKYEMDYVLPAIRRLHRMGQAVGITVDLIGNDKAQDHIVALSGLLPDGDFLIKDPAFGKEVRFSERYGRPETGVMGYVAVIGQAINFPDHDGLPDESIALTRICEARKMIDALPVAAKDAMAKANIKFWLRDAADALL